jgi:hypothetical protein
VWEGSPVTTCSSCGRQTPEGNYCVRCGASLGAGFSAPSRGRVQFAAAAHELVALPLAVSTLFPHLRRNSQLSFRLVLGLSTVVIVVLAAPRLFPSL